MIKPVLISKAASPTATSGLVDTMPAEGAENSRSVFSAIYVELDGVRVTGTTVTGVSLRELTRGFPKNVSGSTMKFYGKSKPVMYSLST